MVTYIFFAQSRRLAETHVGKFSCEVSIVLIDFNKNSVVLTHFTKTLQYQIS